MPLYADWPLLPLADTVEILRRGTAPVYVDSSSIHAIGQRCIQDRGLDLTAARPHDHRVSKGLLRPKPGDVLLNSTGTGTIGRSCIFRSDADCMIDSHVTLLRCKADMLDSRWLRALLASPYGQRHLELHCYSGSTNQIELVGSRLSSTFVPIPNLSEQLHIAEILDEIAVFIERLSERIVKLKNLRSGLLLDALNGVSAPSVLPGWRRIPLGDLVVSVDYGISSPLSGDPAGIPVLRMNNVGDGRVHANDIKFSTEHVSGELRLKYGDVLFNRTNSIEHVGRSGMWRNELSEATFASYLVRINTDPTQVDPEYLALWLTHPLVRSRIRAISTPAVQQVNVNPTKLQRLLIDLPSDLGGQRRTLASLAKVDKQLERERRELEKLKTLQRGLTDDLLTGRVRVKRVLGAIGG
ncbi:restriction endonuclease subunit S [Nonomuraea phyllanthi]